MSEPAPAIEAVELGKMYGKKAKAVHALAAVTFAIDPGIVFALLGPNGAGTSTKRGLGHTDNRYCDLRVQVGAQPGPPRRVHVDIAVDHQQIQPPALCQYCGDRRAPIRKRRRTPALPPSRTVTDSPVRSPALA